MTRALIAIALAVVLAASAARARAQPAPAPAPDDAPAAGESPEPTPLPTPISSQPPPTTPPPTTPPDPGVTPIAPALAEPPAQWTRWDLRGRLIDPPARLRALLDSDLRSHRALTADAELELGKVCERLGYHLTELIVERPADGEVVAILELEPIVMVRWVEVDLEQGFSGTITDDEVQRRMRLRPGVYLPWDPPPQPGVVSILQKRLADETERIEAFLRDEGYFEVEARVTIERVGRYGGVVKVKAHLGPGYRVGKVTVVNLAQTGGGLALAAADVAKEFDHGSWCFIKSCRFRRAQLQDDLERVTRQFQRRGFPAVRVQSDFDPRTSFDRDSKRVVFSVSIDPRRRVDVRFEGNDKDDFPDDLLTNELTFGAATSADDIEVEASARALERRYQSRGYLDVIVTSERLRRGTFDQVIYRIEPGRIRTVRSIDFACHTETGAGCSLPIADLEDAVVTRTTGSFTVLETRAYPTREILLADAGALERLYRNRGFRSARVKLAVAPRPSGWASAALAAAEVAGEVSPRDVHVRFVIDEGPRTVIERIEIVFEGGAAGGRFAGDEARVRDRLTVRAGDPYLQDTLDAQARALKDWYWSLGRPRAVVTVGAPIPLADDQHVAVTFNIEEKQELHLGEVVIRGNFRTKSWIIRDLLGWRRGVPLTAELQSGGLRRLRSSNLFNSVAFDLLDFEETRETTVDVVVKVEERSDLDVQAELEGGYSQLTGGFIRLHPVFPNVRGLGIKFDVGGTLGRQYQSLDASVRVPRWLTARYVGVRFDTELAGFVRNQTTARFGDLFSVGGSLAAVRSWERAQGDHHAARLVSAGLRYDVRQRSRDEDAVRPAGVAQADNQNPIGTRTGTLGVTLSWDQRRDRDGNLNPLAPSAGFRLDGGVAYASPYLLGQDTFLKLNALGQVFWTRGRIQLRADGRYDQGIPLDGSVLLPEVERFFAGGDDTVRGFDEDRLATELIAVPVPPLDGGCDPANPTAGGLCQIRLLPAGGNIRMLGTLDAQLTVGKIGLPFPFATAIFTDAGVVTNTWSAVRLRSIRPSAGMALRLLLPIGAVSIEWAVPLQPRLGDNPRGRFHLAVALRY